MIEVSFMEEDQYGTQKTPISTSKIWILKISPVSWILFHNFSISTNKQKQSFLFTITANTFQRHFCGRGLSHSLICPINTVYVKDFRSSPLLSPQTHKNPRNRQNTQTLILNMKRRNIEEKLDETGTHQKNGSASPELGEERWEERRWEGQEGYRQRV